MLFPSLKEAKSLAEHYSTIPVAFTFTADHCTPLGMYMALAEGEEDSFLLEGFGEEGSRYIAAGAAPNMKLRFRDRHPKLWMADKWNEISSETPWSFIHHFLEANTSPQLHPFFTGGFVGCFPDEEGTHGSLCVYNELAVYDTLCETITVIVNLHSTSDLSAQYQAAEIRAAEIAAKIDRYHSRPQYWDDKPPVNAELAFDASEFFHEQAVVKEAVVENAPDGLEVYRRLRHAEGTDSCGYIRMGDSCVLGSFPERTVPPASAVGCLDYCSRSDLRRGSCMITYEGDRAVVTAGAVRGAEYSPEEAASLAAKRVSCLLRAMEDARR